MNKFTCDFSKTRAVQFSDKAKSVINTALSMSYLRQIIPYNPAWLNNYIPNSTYLLDKETRESLKDFSTLGIFGDRKQFIIDCAYASSKLEGNSFSLEDVEKYKGEFVDIYSEKENIMIFNHFVALDSIVSYKYIKYDPFTVKVIHGELSSGLLSDNKFEGELRDTSIPIPDSNYKPLSDKSQIKEQLKIILEKAGSIADPFEQSFFLLTFITYLQPFIAYNEMTARIMATLPFIKNKICPLTYLMTEKEDYRKALLALYELNDTLPLQEFYKSIYKNSVIR